MVIDIDSFLDRYEDKKDEIIEQEKEISLEFEDELKSRITDYEQEAMSGDFEILKKIYDEIKKFDEKIPLKFSNLENFTSSTLKNLGGKYTQEYYKKLLEVSKNIETNIKEHIYKLDNALQVKNFVGILNEFGHLSKLYQLYPKELYSKKFELFYEIKKKEVIIDKLIHEYKITTLTELKLQIKRISLDLSKSLIPGNLVNIEQIMEKLNSLIFSIPKLFISDIAKEKVVISALMLKAQKFLLDEYYRDFEARKERINILISNYHEHLSKNDFEKTLVTYDEILFQFENLPDVFIEEKMKIYDQLNDLYTLVNKLLMKNNVSLFFESYNSSRILEEVRDYLRHVKISKLVNHNAIINMVDKLNTVSSRFTAEKDELLYELQKLKLLPSNSAEISKVGVDTNQILGDDVYLKNLTYSNKLGKKDLEKIKNSDRRVGYEWKQDPYQIKDAKFKSSVLQEINVYYQRLKKTQNPQETKLLYKKIVFYLNSVALPKNLKDDTLKKINAIVSAKKFN